jgi:hypothetical protein
VNNGSARYQFYEYRWKTQVWTEERCSCSDFITPLESMHSIYILKILEIAQSRFAKLNSHLLYRLFYWFRWIRYFELREGFDRSPLKSPHMSFCLPRTFQWISTPQWSEHRFWHILESAPKQWLRLAWKPQVWQFFISVCAIVRK